MTKIALTLLVIVLTPIFLIALGTIFSHISEKISLVYSPFIGLSVLILTAAAASTIFDLSTSASIFLCSGVLLALLAYFEFKKRIFARLSTLKHASLISAVSLLVALVFAGSKSKFGSLNFDFLWNLNDSFYLQTHTMSQFYNGNSTGQLPFNWSANPGGRYGASYLFAALNSIGFHPLIWSFAIYCVFLGLLFYGFFGISRLIFNHGAVKSLIFGLIAFTAPLSLLSASYFVIGQISGIPFTLFIMYLSFKVLQLGEPEQEDLVLLILFVAGLSWIYPAQLLVLAPLLILVILRITKVLVRERLRLKFLLAVILTGSLIAVVNLHFLYLKFSQVIDVSTARGSQNGSSGVVFSQFLSSRGPGISLGLIPYPFKGSRYLGLSASLLATIIVGWVILHIVTEFQRGGFTRIRTNPVTFFFIYSILLFLGSFFIIRSNYTTFKIAAWFAPLFVALLIFSPPRIFLAHAWVLTPLAITALFLSGSASAIYLDQIWKGFDKNFSYTHDAGQPELINFLSSQQFAGVYFALPSMEDAAWATVELPATPRSKVHLLGASQQALAVGETSECYIADPILRNSLIVLDDRVVDVVPTPDFQGKPIWRAGNYRVYRSSQLQSASRVVGGAFYPESAPFGDPSKKNYIRWAAGSFCLATWSPSSKSAALTVSFVSGPDMLSKPNFSINGNSQLITKNHDVYNLVDNSLFLHSGWNYIKVTNGATMKRISPHTPRPDFRTLGLALRLIEVES